MAEYKPYRILVDTSGSKIDLNKELIKAVPPEYSIPSYIPPRIVEIYEFSPLYVNSTRAIYYLTDEEANILSEDERILEIISLEDDAELTETLSLTQTANFSRPSPGDNIIPCINWGLYSSTNLGTPLESLYDIVDTSGQVISDGANFTASYNYTLDGTGVDLFVIDAQKINPFHQDFYDYTGTYSRIQSVNWGEYLGWDPQDFYSSNQTVKDYIFSSSYHIHDNMDDIITASIGNYVPPSDINHCMQCMSIAGGKVYGWAKNATLYYLKGSLGGLCFDIIRAFHEQKSIDPTTGYKRPTVVSYSAGGRVRDPFLTYEGIFYSGSYISGATPNVSLGFTLDNKLPTRRSLGQDVDLTNMTDSGVIYVHSSMNDGQIFFRASPDIETEHPIPERYKSIHYNNYISSSEWPSQLDYKYYYHQGSSPSNLAAVEVGALDISPTDDSYQYSQLDGKERPAGYSNHGGGTDIYAPSKVVCASMYSSVSSSFLPNIDPEGTSPSPDWPGSGRRYFTNAFNISPIGTSFAAPQIAGVACLYFQMNPGADVWQFKQFLLDHAKPVKIPPSEDNGGPIDVWAEGNVKTEGGVGYIALNGAPTASLFWPYSSPNKSTGLPVFTK